MKKWLLPVFATILTCGSTVPVFAETVNNPANDHAYITNDGYSPTVGNSKSLHLDFMSVSNNTPDLQVQTTLGSLNGQGSTFTLTPSNGVYSDLVLTSTVAGKATVNVFENGVLIGSTQVTFLPGALGSITVQASPSNALVGGNTMITIHATDIYGNPVGDNTVGTTFNLVTTAGQLTPAAGTTQIGTGLELTVSTHNGTAQVLLTDLTPGTATVTVSEASLLPFDVSFNGNQGASSINIPVNFDYGQSITTLPVTDFNDTTLRPANELSAERELYQIGVLHGDSNHYYYPTTTITRSEFAQIVAQYMGLSTVAYNLKGTPTKFADVDPTAWYDGAVAADASLGYMHGDGTNFYPNNAISYAEVAMVLLNNLGVQTTGHWPDNAISYGLMNGLFNGLTNFSANQPATRGDVAIMVRNALHLVPPAGGIYTSGKTLEAEELGYTWNGDDQPTTVLAVPGTGLSVGNEVQVQTATATTTLHLANTVQMAGASSLSDLMNKKIKYLTNAVGLVTYIEVTP